jgi:hypothetical protein
MIAPVLISAAYTLQRPDSRRQQDIKDEVLDWLTPGFGELSEDDRKTNWSAGNIAVSTARNLWGPKDYCQAG